MNIRGIAAVADIIVGAWLVFFSLFLGASPEHAANTALVGASSLGLGVAAHRGHDACRFIVAFLAVWLFVSVWVLPHGTASIVANHMMSATLMFGFSALPTGRGRATGAYPL